jgi:TatD DNase family protein
MFFIDTHAHLYLEEFRNDIQEVMKHADNEHIKKIILPNIDLSTIGLLHDLVNTFPDTCIPLMGLHPTYVKENSESELEKIIEQLRTYAYHGIGEIGIDLYWDKTYLAQQIEAFTYQLDLALEMNLPVVIHARDSFSEIMQVVKLPKYAGLKGIFHAFTGNAELA